MENIRIQDDLYNYVNQQKLAELVIPADKPMAGGFAELAVLGRLHFWFVVGCIRQNYARALQVQEVLFGVFHVRFHTNTKGQWQVFEHQGLEHARQILHAFHLIQHCKQF